jgi:2'-5' RNA ligase
MRLFVGIPLDEEARRGVGKVVKKLKRGHWPVRWEKENKWHMTLAFVGEIEAGELGRVVRAVKRGAGGIKRFEVRFKGLGAFPGWLLPRIVWMGLKGDLKRMARVYKGVRGELEREGFEFDKKPFRGHITLGRVKKEAKRKHRLELGKYLKKQAELEIPQRWLVDRVVIYESQLGSAGSEYKVIEEVRLV